MKLFSTRKKLVTTLAETALITSRFAALALAPRHMFVTINPRLGQDCGAGSTTRMTSRLLAATLITAAAATGTTICDGTANARDSLDLTSRVAVVSSRRFVQRKAANKKQG